MNFCATTTAMLATTAYVVIGMPLQIRAAWRSTHATDISIAMVVLGAGSWFAWVWVALSTTPIIVAILVPNLAGGVFQIVLSVVVFVRRLGGEKRNK